MTMPAPADQTIYELRTYCESCSKEYDVPMERIVEFAASIGGAELYCSRGDVLGPHEFRDKVLSFCRADMLSRLPPDQRDAISNAAQRFNYVNWREWQETRAWPLLRTRGYLRVDFDHVICKALGVPSVNYLHKFRGNSDDATKRLIDTIQPERGIATMTEAEYESKRKQVIDHVTATWAKIGIQKQPGKQRTHVMGAFGTTIPDMIASPNSAEIIIAKFDDYMKPVIAQYEELKAHGLAGSENGDGGKKDEPPGLDSGQGLDRSQVQAPAAPIAAEQTDLFNHDLAEAAEKLKSLPDVAPNGWVVKYDTANPNDGGKALIDAPNDIQAIQKRLREFTGDPNAKITTVYHNRTGASPKGWEELVEELKKKAQEGQGEAKDTPAAIPTPEPPTTPPAEAALPAQTASENPPEEPSIEPSRLFVKEDREFADLELLYNLEAKWDKADGDMWFAMAVTKRRLSDDEENTLHKEVERYLQERRPADVILDIEYEPTAPEIDELRKTAQKMISELFPTDNQIQQAEHFKVGTGHEKAADALRIEDKDPILRRLHAYLMQENERRKAEQAESEKALTTLPHAEVQTQATNIIQMPTFGFRLPTMPEMAFIEFMAKRVVKSGFYPSIKSEDQAIMVMVKGYTLGVDPMSSLDGIEPIIDKNGKITMSFRSKLLKALVERTGQCERFDVVVDENKAVATVQRKGREIHTYTYTFEDAQKANLTGKFNWQNHKKKMLMWRVVSQAVDIDFPEVRYVFTQNEPDDEAA